MRTSITVAGLACVALLAGCSKDEADKAASGKTGTDAETADLTPERGVNISALWGGGKPMPVDLQATHPGGMVLQLTSIQVKPTETVVGVSVVNGDSDEQMLNQFPTNRNGYILAANGERFFLSPPSANPNLSVPAGQRMQGELVFLGRIPKEGAAVLVLNDGDTRRNQYSNSPGFRIDLPLSDAAFSDDGSKKN